MKVGCPLLVLLGFFMPLSLIAQYTEKIHSGRPGQAIDPYSVGVNVFQVQSGYQHEQIQMYGDGYLTGNYVENVLRFGINNHIEFGALILYKNETLKLNDSSYVNRGINAFGFNLRSNILNGNNNTPTVGLRVDLLTPWVHLDYKPNFIAPRFTLVACQNLGSKMSLTANFGGVWDGFTAEPLGFYVVNLSCGLNTRMSVFVEHYASFKHSYWNARADCGVGFVANDNLQLDIFGGVNANEGHLYKEWFISVGLSWRIKMGKIKVENEG